METVKRFDYVRRPGRDVVGVVVQMWLNGEACAVHFADGSTHWVWLWELEPSSERDYWVAVAGAVLLPEPEGAP